MLSHHEWVSYSFLTIFICGISLMVIHAGSSGWFYYLGLWHWDGYSKTGHAQNAYLDDVWHLFFFFFFQADHFVFICHGFQNCFSPRFLWKSEWKSVCRVWAQREKMYSSHRAAVCQKKKKKDKTWMSLSAVFLELFPGSSKILQTIWTVHEKEKNIFSTFIKLK